MTDAGPQDLAARFAFKQPRSRRDRASVRNQRATDRAQPLIEEDDADVRHTRVQDLQRGDVFKGWYGRQVVLSLEREAKGFVSVTYRKVRKDRSIIQAGESIVTTLKVDAPVRVLDHINGDLIGSQKGSTTMAKTVTRKSGTKAGAKSGAKPAAAAKKAEGKARRTAADVDALVPDFVEHLSEGGTMRDLKKAHGFSDDGPIRAALYRNGYDSKGNEHGVEGDDIDVSKVAGKKQLVALREGGAGWYVLAYRAGITEAEAKAIVTEAGGSTERVYVKNEKEPAGKKAAGKGKQTPAQKRAAKKAADADPS